MSYGNGIVLYGRGYCYGFNGKEKDDEVKGDGVQYDYGFRIYDARIAKFLSVDPLTKSYPMLTPYQFASNSPVSGIDMDGLEYYYAADGTLLGKIGTSNEVRLVNEKYVKETKQMITQANDKNLPEGYWVWYKLGADNRSESIGMTNEELNTRAFMTTIKETENGCNSPLPYNAKHGFKDGKLNTFTDKSYEDAPEDYSEHAYKDATKGGTAAGAYQMLYGTFKAMKKANPEITDFGPYSQDKAVIQVFTSVGALEDIKQGDIDAAAKKLVKDQWGHTQFTSLPGGGQEKKGFTMAALKKMFKANVSKVLAGKSDVSLPKGGL